MTRWLRRIGAALVVLALAAGAALWWTGAEYPPDTPGVQGVLYAWGDGIRAGHAVGRVDAIDIHPTVTRLLGVAAGEPVDGQVARDLLSDG